MLTPVYAQLYVCSIITILPDSTTDLEYLNQKFRMYSLVWILILTDFDQPWPLLIPTSTTLDFHLDLYPTLTLTPTPMLNSDLELTSVPTFNNNSISHYHSWSHPVLDILHFTPHHSSLLYLIPTPRKLRWRKDLGAQHISWSRIVSQQLLCPDFNSNSNRT